MPKLSFSRRVPYTPSQMLELVAEISRYPEFVPNCTRMDVRPDPSDPNNICFARMHIAFGPIEQAYTSHVKVDRDAMTIAADATDGPFAHLQSLWTFEPDGEGTRIGFEVDFKIRNPLLAAAAEPAFAAKQEEIIDAFVLRAGRIYG